MKYWIIMHALWPREKHALIQSVFNGYQKIGVVEASGNIKDQIKMIR